MNSLMVRAAISVVGFWTEIYTCRIHLAVREPRCTAATVNPVAHPIFSCRNGQTRGTSIAACCRRLEE